MIQPASWLTSAIRSTALILSFCIAFAGRAQAQRPFFHFGFTSSHTVSVDCYSFSQVSLNATSPAVSSAERTARDPCPNPYRFRSIDALYFLTAGASMLTQPLRALELQVGALLTLKGSEQNYEAKGRGYLEIPILAGLGSWPSTQKRIGGGVLVGLAGDVGLPKLSDSDVAYVVGGEVRGRFSGGSQWSLSLRYAASLRGGNFLRNQTVSLLFGISPSRRSGK